MLYFIITIVFVAHVSAYSELTVAEVKQLEKISSSNCEDYRACVECLAFNQPWQQFSEPHSAYKCWVTCGQFTILEDAELVDGCEMHGSLDGDTACPPIKYYIKQGEGGEVEIHYNREPCEREELEVNEGIWHGETIVSGYSTFPDGWGLLTFRPGDALNRDRYEGFMAAGLFQGHGSMWWTDGSRYTGTFRNNTKSGDGAMFYSNGDIYTGHWSAERKDAAGMYMYAVGGELEAEFREGKVDGAVSKLTILHQGGMDGYTGQYVEGARSEGEYSHSNGDTYLGSFEAAHGRYDAQGKYVWACGKTYEGSFKNGKPDGAGVMTYPQGWKYVGEFKQGKFHGTGKFSWSEDNYYEGSFLAGAMTGVGVYQLSDGGLFDAAAGLYYPDGANRENFHEAHFDGHTLRYKKAKPAGNLQQGYN